LLPSPPSVQKAASFEAGRASTSDDPAGIAGGLPKCAGWARIDCWFWMKWRATGVRWRCGSRAWAIDAECSGTWAKLLDTKPLPTLAVRFRSSFPCCSDLDPLVADVHYPEDIALAEPTEPPVA